MKYTYKQSATCSLKSNQANPFLQFLFVSSDQGWIPMLRGPRHMPGTGTPQLLAVIPTPPAVVPPPTLYIYSLPPHSYLTSSNASLSFFLIFLSKLLFAPSFLCF